MKLTEIDGNISSNIEAPVPETLLVSPWSDPVVDRIGHDLRSPYVERFWLPVLGPSAVQLLRHIGAELDVAPTGFPLEVAESARALGLGIKEGKNSLFVRSIRRCCVFGLSRLDERAATLHVRRRVPPLASRQLSRLPAGVRADHEHWTGRPPAA